MKKGKAKAKEAHTTYEIVVSPMVDYATAWVSQDYDVVPQSRQHAKGGQSSSPKSATVSSTRISAHDQPGTDNAPPHASPGSDRENLPLPYRPPPHSTTRTGASQINGPVLYSTAVPAPHQWPLQAFASTSYATTHRPPAAPSITGALSQWTCTSYDMLNPYTATLEPMLAPPQATFYSGSPSTYVSAFESDAVAYQTSVGTPSLQSPFSSLGSRNESMPDFAPAKQSQGVPFNSNEWILWSDFDFR